MAIKEIKREWSPSQCDYVKHYLLHWEKDVKDLPACCVGSRATVGETDHEYVCTECGWVRAEFVELAKIAPDILTDPDVKILYDPERTEIGESEFRDNTDIDVVYFPNVKVIQKYAFYGAQIKAAIFPNVETVYISCFKKCANLESVYMPKLVTNYADVFYGCTALTDATFPAWESLAKGGEFSSCSNLVNLHLPKVKDISYYSIQMCTALKMVDFPCLETLNGRAFQESALTTLILRNDKVCTLTTAFRNCPIASGTGYIYVPAALIEDYKTATNWSTYAAQIRAIEDWPEICGPDWEGHTGDVVIPSGKSLTLIDSAGGKWKLVVGTDGTLSTEAVS